MSSISMPKKEPILEGVEVELTNQETGEQMPAVELIDPMSKWAVEYAADKWNCSKEKAAQEIARKKLGKQIDKRDFMQIVEPQPA